MNKIIVSAAICLLISTSQCTTKDDAFIMTVNGPVKAKEMGITLTHEHILVDFIGADSINSSRWDKSQVTMVAIPFLRKLKETGCKTFIECTPAFLGRDPLLLKSISDSAGLNIVTNTGYYGAGNDKFIPAFAFSETADQLASRWIKEYEEGIEGTGIKPGFIKIGVMNGNLSELHKKLVIAAARTHLKTGLTIASHTGPAIPAFEEIGLLRKEGVSPSAFIWVHAQVEKDSANHVKAAQMGAWISFDGVNENNTQEYLNLIVNMKKNHLLNRVLLSHDAGWYHPGEENGGEFRGYTALFEKLLPLLRKEEFSETEINQILVVNPEDAFSIRIRTLPK